MKKLLALTLAIAMVLGMSTIAMAASKPSSINLNTGSVYTLSGKSMTEVTNNSKLAPGKTYYMHIESTDNAYNNGKKNITSTSALSGYRLRMRPSEGSKAMGSQEYVIKDVTNGIFKDSTRYSSTKHAFVAINTKESYATSDVEVVMGGGIFAGDNNSVNGGSSVEDYFAYTIGYGETMADFDTMVSDESPMVNFDDITDTEEIEIYFASADSNLRFIVNAKNQTPLFLRYKDDPDGTNYSNIVDKYPDASLDFHLFEGTKKTFKRSGKLYIPAVSIERGNKMGAPYIYEIEDNKLKEISPKYDLEAEEFAITTNKLGNYLITDRKLSSTSSSSSSEDEDEEEEEEKRPSTSSKEEEDIPPPPTNPGAQINPDTGVTEVVGLAAAFAVISIGAIGATTFYKKRGKK